MKIKKSLLFLFAPKSEYSPSFFFFARCVYVQVFLEGNFKITINITNDKDTTHYCKIYILFYSMQLVDVQNSSNADSQVNAGIQRDAKI